MTKKQNIQMYNQIYFVAIIKFDGACVMVNAAAHKHEIWSKWFNILEYYFIIPTLISISYKLKWIAKWQKKSDIWNISFLQMLSISKNVSRQIAWKLLMIYRAKTNWFRKCHCILHVYLTYLTRMLTYLNN